MVISFVDRITLAVYILVAALHAYIRFLTNLLTQRPSPSFRRQLLDSLVTFLRELNARGSIAQMQSLLPLTTDVYIQWSRKNKVPLQIDSIPMNVPNPEQDQEWAENDETDPALHWLGPRDATKIALYIHGGAFWAPALDHNFTYLHALQTRLQHEGTDISFVALSYSLLPTTSLKSQIHQARNALAHLISTHTSHPSNIYISGDSAGAALCLALASHILHPLDDIPPLHLSSPLAGLILISPWVRIYQPTDPDPSRAADSDVCTPSTFAAWGRIVQSHSNIPLDTAMIGYLNPLDAPPTWFEHLAEKVTSRVFLTSGGKEVFHPDILSLSQLLKRSQGAKHTFECVHVVDEEGVHDQSLMGPALGWLVGWGYDEQGKKDHGEAFLETDKLSKALVDWLRRE